MIILKNNICVNCYLCMFKRIKELPDELKDLIFSLIPIREKILLNKEYYFKNHYCYNLIYTDSYVRKILRNDFLFLFKNYLSEEKILETCDKRKNVTYKKVRYKNYREYLKALCDIYEAFKCKVLL